MDIKPESTNPGPKQELITGLEELSLPSFVVDRVKEQAESWSDKQINFCRQWTRKEWLMWYYMEW